MRAAVAGDMNQTIVGAGPDSVDVKRRGCNRIDHSALRRLRRRLRSIFTDAFWDFESLAREIGADLFPVSPSVFCLPQSVRGEIEDVRIDWRKDHWLSSQHA